MGKKQASPAPSPKKARKAGADVPDVASMGGLVMAAGSKPKESFDGNIHIAVLTYCTNGSVYNEMFDEGALHVMVMASGGQPNPLFLLGKTLELYGKTTRESDDPEPENLDDVAEKYNAKYQFVSKKTGDQDNVSWRRFGAGFYITGGAAAIKGFLMYLDDVISWRAEYEDETFEPLAEKPKIFVYVSPDETLALDKKTDELKCDFEVVKGAEHTFTVFDLPPPTFPNRIVVLTFELVSATQAHLIFSGNTKPFQAGFGALKIKGKSVQVNTNDKFKEFFRVREEMDLTDEDACASELKNIFGVGCLQSSPVVVRIKETKHAISAVQKIMACLTNCPNVRMEL